MKLRQSFQNRIVGQADATDALTNLLERHISGFADPKRPIGSALFMGPTGTGKTSVVEAMCEGLFGFEQAMIKIDCAEFQHSHEIAKLIGSPPGYLGHQETPARFTQTALNQWHSVELPISVVLFDEIEKASDAVWQLLLNILDKGTLTLGNNTQTSFRQTIIVMTSNIGAKQMDAATGEDMSMGFQSKTDDSVNDKELKNISMSAARKKFTPEFLNRLDEIVHFKTLTRPQIEEIMGMELGKLQSKLFANNSSRLIPSPSALRELMSQGYDKKYNARNIRRTIEKQIMTPIARLISSGQLKNIENIVVDARDGNFEFIAVPR